MYPKIKRATASLAALVAALAPLPAQETPEVPASLSLQTTLEFALENNFAIKQSIEAIKEQEGLIVEVKARALPSLAVNASYYQLDEGLSEANSFFPASTESWGITLSARQALYQGGGIRAALEVQDLLRESSLLALETTVLDALLEVRTRYYAALLARDQIGVEEQNIELLEETLNNAKLRRDAGDVSDFEVLRAEVALANAQPALIRRRGAYRVAIEQLRQSMGYQNYRRDAHNLERIPEFTDELVYRPIDYELQAALDQALANRSELKQLEAIAKAREAGLEIANAGLKPSLDLVGTYGKQRSSFSSSFDDGPDGWTVGVEASWNIWDGRKTKGQRLQAQSQLEQARIQQQSYRLGIEVQVRQAISALQEADQLAKAAVKVVEQAEEAVRMADSRFETGSISQLDVLEARVALTEARTNALAANYQHLVAVAQYRRALGSEAISREAWPSAE
ncbi:TolC family protein [Pelagicoccus sp. SDUM812005]|uniref:TolC family protein n=1 Tax=Pelagicoccus sp. SDUM812005 TaxID=3041257 RepID=UPI00280EEE3C|nr:TolC family protein [Pelagicoccus sp. SDUM812005]MDQ8179332.1 TolC family protein [Pelagicoccus sp. SDUM812005]